MKITVNGKISEEALKIILESQKKKTLIIDEYCKKEKLDSMSYKDSELEYEYIKEAKQSPPKPKKVETRKNVKGN
jgi:hypothetical protein